MIVCLVECKKPNNIPSFCPTFLFLLVQMAGPLLL
jgi:hypothetical protein